MKPMEPMKPLSGGQKWWPNSLGQPSSSGSQNDMRYAFFPDKQCLLVENNGELTIYDSGTHRIQGVSAQQSHDHHLVLTSQNGAVDLANLKQV